MISATEARKITDESRSKLQKTIDELDYYIDDAIHEVSEETVGTLKAYGYSVIEADTHFQIIW